MRYRMGKEILSEAWHNGGGEPEPAWVAEVALRLDDDEYGARYAVETYMGTAILHDGEWLTRNVHNGKVGVWPDSAFHGLYREDPADDGH